MTLDIRIQLDLKITFNILLKILNSYFIHKNAGTSHWDGNSPWSTSSPSLRRRRNFLIISSTCGLGSVFLMKMTWGPVMTKFPWVNYTFGPNIHIYGYFTTLSGFSLVVRFSSLNRAWQRIVLLEPANTPPEHSEFDAEVQRRSC